MPRATCVPYDVLPNSRRKNQTVNPWPSATHSRGRRQRLLEHLHKLGAPAIGHLLDQVADEAGCGAAIDRALVEFSAIDVRIVHAAKGDRFARILDEVVEAA